MTRYLLAGGGTAGHVNPLLATADEIRLRNPGDEVLVLGTAEGLEARLVPLRGYELSVIPRLPFPRRPNAAALRFPLAFRATIDGIVRTIRERGIDAVVGFGGYAAAPAYLAARRARIPFVVHEANARPGLANRLGARATPHVGVAFEGTPLPHAQVVGMPLRREIAELDRSARREEGRLALGLDPERPTLLVTGGSLGARRINATVHASASALVATGFQILHITGDRAEITDPGIDGYHLLAYCDRMDLALSASDFAVSRAGAATVSELSALGLPAVYVPYPVGNGEQRVNARGVVDAGGALLVEDAAFLPVWVERVLVPLLGDSARRDEMARRAARVGVRDGSGRLVDLIGSSLTAPR
ncbi:UDP-N-acetylglucosamine--N-acetylmuramyl-(pentapeptide) pyrophosphoryl-undecaprenol N-acetylglucosamine transferase [Rathayibacter tanaceti]|uniref:UDP-N-acetylglucosamine--N-acetylmuramyl-(pentapeptide) pyrophosphoryl-undecaprenol N-acetylglucosamine transferase n=2 Tax=Rathayibacter tanaceti TaxID=1671680 RepID=A0A168G7E8_9MICO|nr:UDP-N-acetylglucosamine--N-acetylmuramyl-(pentapeptide) pyrophosphoryl-undecaprenol N-acetylglucosamine transferase [Rathayibacter tanaceti]KZX21842.1 UDP-N-acetylglucosamine--N-acetylmuramyl-(pentapeptide) pyrophosphoryl-undecaprenol N-acetylglucosamine transferase [Rathayibacter tanaceti]QHC55298.1 UDP-N-acetylglucosamine--N-acetylmuramyl-(pentapeptide) pyrophosphoryl-undecaprenol N-acetylglucosamine transferase [Rathayibacter tanaceti]TCO36404.1 UDP-N-acetylglucosamine--N-acetylmuramyl-(pe